VKKRILLIEQDTLTALWEEDLLTEAGYEVECATGMLDRVRSLVVGARADAAVLKAHLYGEATTDLAIILQARRVPFVFASAYGAALRARLPSALQNVRILARPCNGKKFLATVEALTGAR
jgi:DNA-binding response OmpR family regulator